MGNGVQMNVNMENSANEIPLMCENLKESQAVKYHRNGMNFSFASTKVPYKIQKTKKPTSTISVVSFDSESTQTDSLGDCDRHGECMKPLIAGIAYLIFAIAVTLFILFCGQYYEPQSMNAYTLQ